MMYKLKHYQGLLNLEKFTRIEKCCEESYKLKRQKSVGANKIVSEPDYTYSIKFYTPEGYGGLSSSIEYDNEQERDEDYDIIVELVCKNKNDNNEELIVENINV